MFRMIRVPALVLLLGLVVAACGGDVEAEKRAYVASGDAYVADKKYAEAIIEYRKAIAQDERFGEARLKLARAYAQVGDVDRYRAESVRAADLLPKDVSAQLEAAKALLRSGQFPDAATRAEKVLVLDPKNTEAYIVRGNAKAGQRDFAAALEAFQEGLVAQPNKPELRVNAAFAQAAQGRAVEAEASFKQAIVVSPQSMPARLALVNYYWGTGRQKDAEAAVIEALKLDPKSVPANWALASIYAATNRQGEAEAPLLKAVESAGTPGAKLTLADYYVFVKRYSNALPILEELAKQPSVYAAATARRAGVEYQLGNRDKAHATIDEVIAREPKNASVHVVKGGWLLLEQKLDAALASAQTAVNADSESWSAYDLLGSVQAARRQPEEATKAFSDALRLNPRALNAQMALSDLNIASGKIDAGVQFAREAVQTDPSSGLARMMLVKALLAKNDAGAARSELQPLLAVAPQSAIVQALAGQVELKQGNRDAARQAFERAAAIDPTSIDALIGLLDVDGRSKRPDQAVARVRDYTKRVPDSPRAFYLAARAYAATGDLENAKSSARKAIELDPAYFQAYNLLGQLYVRERKLDDARQEYERVVQRRPKDVAAYTMIAMIYQVQQNAAEARKTYEKILSLDPRAPVASNNLAYMHAEEGANLDVALNLAQTAKAALPDEPDVSDTLGWVYVKRNLPKIAIVHLEESVHKDPANPVYQYHLGLAYLNAGDKGKARTALEQALKLQPNFDGASAARKALATIQG